MAKINFGNKKLKIFAATMVTIFSLLVVFVGSIAWFSTNNHTSNGGNQTSVIVKGKFKKISYHNYTGNPTTTNWSFNKTPYASIEYNWTTKTFDQPKNGQGETIASFDLEMQQYDPMNKNKPILVLIELQNDYDTSTQGNVIVNGVTTTVGFLGAKEKVTIQEEGQQVEVFLPEYNLDGTDPNLKIKTVNQVDYYPLSSVVKFRSRGFSNTDFGTWSGGSTYDLTSENTYPPLENKDFTVVDNEKDESNFYQTSRIYDSGNDATIKYVAIVVDYNDAAIEYIYSTYLGDTTLEGTYEYVLNYTCDWKWEIF